MFEKVAGEYSDSMVWREKPEPKRVDPKLDKVTLSVYLKETGWDVALLEYAIAGYGHPKPIGRQINSFGDFSPGEPVYSRSQIGRWRERLIDDVRRFGFTVKK